jgi:hypothetical protein
MISRFFACPLDQQRACAWRKWIFSGITVLMLFAMLVAACTNAQATPTGDPAVGAPQLSENGHFLVSYRAAAPPITLNTTHTWLLDVQTPEGAPVSATRITVTGGMPAHNHGLPTQPQVIATDKAGEYKIEGMRFQMPGEWTVTVTINAGDLTDQVTLPFVLP